MGLSSSNYTCVVGVGVGVGCVSMPLVSKFIASTRYSKVEQHCSTEDTHQWGKYHCLTELLFDWFGFNQRSKADANST